MPFNPSVLSVGFGEMRWANAIDNLRLDAIQHGYRHINPTVLGRRLTDKALSFTQDCTARLSAVKTLNLSGLCLNELPEAVRGMQQLRCFVICNS